MIWREWHHGYLGIGLVIFGALLLWLAIAIHYIILIIVAKVIITIGFIILADDIYQHTIQELIDATYVSPLHKFFSKYLWKYEKVKKITAWFNNLFK